MIHHSARQPRRRQLHRSHLAAWSTAAAVVLHVLRQPGVAPTYLQHPPARGLGAGLDIGRWSDGDPGRRSDQADQESGQDTGSDGSRSTGDRPERGGPLWD